MKKYALTVAATTCVLMVGLAACSSTDATTGAGANASAPGPSALTDAAGDTDISIWHGLGSANGKAFQALIDQFNATNPNHIHVTASYQGVYADLLAKYTAALRSSTAPTLMLAGDVASGYMADVKHSIPAAAMAKANPGDLSLSDISPAGRNYYTVNGVQQAVPMNMSTPVLWVDRDLLRQAGISDSTDLSTVDAMIAAATTVKQKTGMFGYTMQDDDWTTENYTATAGQNFCTPDNGRTGQATTAITINSGAAATALSKIVNLYRTGVALDGEVDGSAAISAFAAGKVAFMPYSSGILGALKTDGTTFDYQALPFPASDARFKGNTTVGGSALWLSSTATPAQQVAGWKLETFLTSPGSQEQFSHATGYVPVNTKVDASPTQKSFLAANPDFRVFLQQINGSPIRTETAGCVSGAMAAIRSGNVGQLQAAFAGTKPAQAALDAAAQDAQTVLTQYQQQLGH